MEPDRRYAVDLLARINMLSRDGKEIHALFQDGVYSWWAYQQFFLFGQLEEFSKTKNFAQYLLSWKPRFRYGILSKIGVWLFEALTVFVTVIEIVCTRFRNPYAVTFSSDFLDASALPNPRLRNIYQFLDDQKISYAEILHVTTVPSFFRNIRKRKRLGIYMEAFISFARVRSFFMGASDARQFAEGFDLGDFTHDEQQLIRLLVEETAKRIEISKICVSLYRMFFRFIRPNRYLSVDDFRYIPELLRACELEYIPSHVFQHSNFGFLTGIFQLPASEYIFPAHFYTWNAYWASRVKEISPFFSWYAQRIKIGGRSFTPAQPAQVNRSVQPASGGMLSVLVPYEVSVRKDQIAPYMKALLEDPRITVRFALRGTINHIDYDMQIDKYFDQTDRRNPRLVIVKPQGRKEAIQASDIVAGVYSGFLDESIETGIPVCVFKTDFINVNRLDTDSLATLIDMGKGDIYGQLYAAQQTPDAILIERRERVNRGAVDIRETLEAIMKS